MPAKTWTEMTDAERAEITRQEDARESFKDALAASDAPSASEIDRQEDARESYKDALAASDSIPGFRAGRATETITIAPPDAYMDSLPEVMRPTAYIHWVQLGGKAVTGTIYDEAKALAEAARHGGVLYRTNSQLDHRGERHTDRRDGDVWVLRVRA